MAYGELPLIKFPPVACEAITRFSRKLTLALHYKHSELIAPADAWIETRFWTNFHRVTNEIPEKLFKMVPHNTILRRDKVSLDDQFSYKFNLSVDGKMGAYMAAFGQSFLIMGMVCFDASLMENVEDSDIDEALKELTEADSNYSATLEG